MQVVSYNSDSTQESNMKFREFMDNVSRVQGSLSMGLAYAFLGVILVVTTVLLFVAAPVLAFSIAILACLARLIYAGVTGR